MTLKVLSLDKTEQFSNQCTKVEVPFQLIKNTVMKAHEGTEARLHAFSTLALETKVHGWSASQSHSFILGDYL